MTKLSDEIRERHVSTIYPGEAWCRYCGDPFPCLDIRAADALDAQQELLDEARELVEDTLNEDPYTTYELKVFLAKLKENIRGR